MCHIHLNARGFFHFNPLTRATPVSIVSPAEPPRFEDLTILGCGAEPLGEDPDAELDRIALVSGPNTNSGGNDASSELAM